MSSINHRWMYAVLVVTVLFWAVGSAHSQSDDVLVPLIDLPVQVVEFMQFTPDSATLLVAAGGQPLTAWAIADGTSASRVDAAPPGLAISRDATLAAASNLSDLGGWRLYDLRTGDLLADVPCSGGASAIAFNPVNADHLLVGVTSGLPVTYLDSWLISRDMPSGWDAETIAACAPDARVEVDSLAPFAISPDGENVLAGGRLYDTRSLEPTGVVDGIDPATAQVAFSPDSRWLAVIDNGVRLLEIASGGEQSITIPLEDGFTAERAAFSPDGRLLAVTGYGPTGTDGALHAFAGLWAVTDWARISLIPLGEAQPWSTAIAFSPDSRLLAVAHDEITIYSVAFD